jgi:hypothetical protein
MVLCCDIALSKVYPNRFAWVECKCKNGCDELMRCIDDEVQGNRDIRWSVNEKSMSKVQQTQIYAIE